MARDPPRLAVLVMLEDDGVETLCSEERVETATLRRERIPSWVRAVRGIDNKGAKIVLDKVDESLASKSKPLE